MIRVDRVTFDVGVSLDGYMAGPHQTLETPLGEGGQQLHRWMFEEPEANTAALASVAAPTAFVMGRNMFCPFRGEWDESWRGWWGEEPPYHAPVFVLTHHPREPLEMEGGTTFFFVTDGIASALSQAFAASRDGHVGIAGGASTVRQYLAAGLVDEFGLHVAPVLLGSGERPLDGLGGLRVEPGPVSSNHLVTHLSYRGIHEAAEGCPVLD